MAGIPVRYRKGNDSLVNYDFIDFATGAGYKRFYACASNATAATTYFLTTNVTDSAPPYKDMGADWSAAYKKGIDLNFDISFNRPVVVKGTAYINFTTQGRNVVSDPDYYVILYVYHVSAAAAETQIGTWTSTTDTTASRYIRHCAKIALTQKSFAIGESLRVNAELWFRSANNSNYYFYHDPGSGITVVDAYTRTVGTDFTVDIPFRTND